MRSGELGVLPLCKLQELSAARPVARQIHRTLSKPELLYQNWYDTWDVYQNNTNPQAVLKMYTQEIRSE